ncbi:MAG TPA: radical SAM protein [Syntrophomonadaceae bacterium]|nr:radical SAM protein [Syntrophomonadaceae bacterium]HOQ09838.1 radical SAM protein [Syntrophomonadaceae bacterium]HPU48858.1 radical SAM protein [Syntrophomonadaceae bacterium]
MRYEGNIFRPPSEARSYILQCTIGCTHNRCTFCAMYKDKKYRVRPLEEIKADIRMAKLYYYDVEKVFLADGDAIAMDTNELLEVLDMLYKTFPSLRHVGVYASPDVVLKKDMSELTALKAAGLTIAYLGVETGDEELLKDIRKGVTYDEMVEAGLRLRRAGIQLSVTVLLGLAGRTPKAVEHAKNTAKILNEMNPEYIGALTLMVVPRTELYRRMQRGEFELPGPFEILDEMRIMIENLEVQGSEFRSNHASNYLPIKGRLPDDKQKILDLINHIINTNDRRYLRPDYLRAL